MKIFLDANILFSGAQEGCPLQQFLNSLATGHGLTTHPQVLQEAQRNLEKKRPEWNEGLEQLLQKVRLDSRWEIVTGVELVEKDRPVLYAAVGGRASHLLTGDFRHFGKLMGQTIHGGKIVSVRMLYDELSLPPSS